ncbi:MAG: hypothetical protein FWC71_00345 [Defluviitaleaceae bacterium]|nr:hypothetical protein [Defluviitaleaceae bacterium]
MAEITKVYKECVDAKRFIGKKYSHEDGMHGGYGHKWGEWFQEGYFDVLEKLGDTGDGQIGLMTQQNGVFVYYIGYFMPPGTDAPEGYEYVDFPAGELGVSYVQGKDGEVYGHGKQCADKLVEAGILNRDWCISRGGWEFERYVCPRFTTPDADGKIILDHCFYL